jgi:phosphatidate phosphatase APP1
MPEPDTPTVDGAEAAGARRRRRHAPLHLLRRRRADVRIEAYHGHGTGEIVYLRGRVLRDPGVRPTSADRGRVRNLKNTLRRALTDEIPNARVRARFGGSEVETRTDPDGYFALGVPVKEPLPPVIWHQAQLRVLDPTPSQHGAGDATARVLIPPADARFGIISDIDDTVVHTEATHWLRMLRIVLFTSAHTRLPFERVDALYRALQDGPTGREQNPVFYVSSSPWNLYDLLEEFFRVHGIPEGPLFLRDWNFSPRKLLGMGHQEHKLVQIRHLFDTYPSLRWVLIGDSGQEDPEIYHATAEEYPNRVAAIYIRDVTAARRAGQVRALAARVREAGVEMLLVREKNEAAEHAARHGLIAGEALERMRAADAAQAV